MSWPDVAGSGDLVSARHVDGIQAGRQVGSLLKTLPLRLKPEAPAPQNGRRVYSEATTFLLSHILSDRDSRSVAFRLESPLATRFGSAVKTGTGQEMRDNWCIGYTRHYTVGVWVGNLSGEPMRHVSESSSERHQSGATS